MLRKLYLSPPGLLLSPLLWLFSLVYRRPLMLYGHFNRKRRAFRKHTRISSSAVLSGRSNIDLQDHVWVGHYSLLDGTGGIEIGEGVQISSHTCIYTHSSQNAIRLIGRKFIAVPAHRRPDYRIRRVAIGAYSFIGTSCVILPGVTIGKGCIIGAGSVVTGDLADFSVAAGNPARIIGDTTTIDRRLLEQYGCADSYYLTGKAGA